MSEKQSFHPFFTVIAVFTAVAVNFLMVNSSAPPAVILTIMIFNTLLALAFLFGTLKTEYNKEGIIIKFFPFLFKTRVIKWQEVAKAYIREYSPLREFGGWGIRRSKKGKAYTVQGKLGLQLELRDGKKLLIGTQRPEDIAKFLETIEQKQVE